MKEYIVTEHPLFPYEESKPRELIRCKDCKYVMMLRSEFSAKEFGQIYECRNGIFNCPKPNDFCSRAERREK